MALRTSVIPNIDHRLRILSLDVQAVGEVLDQWETLPDIERLIWTREWEQMVSHIYALADMRESGAMNPDQAGVFSDIVNAIQCMAPSLQFRGFVLPDIVVTSTRTEP